jgi:hypothetical protein
MRRTSIPSAIVTLLLLGATAAAAQSLGDVAKQEEERRKSVRTAGKTYTNDNLRTEPAPSAPAPAAQTQPAQPAVPASPPAPGAQTPEAQTPAGQPPAPAPAAQTEADWRKRIATAREAVSRAQIFAEALQSRINALSTDFVNRDDPAQRDVIAAERQKALSELDRVKQEILQHQKEITAIQEEARRAGVPAGWVRLAVVLSRPARRRQRLTACDAQARARSAGASCARSTRRA